jgi:hypothetical protein
MKTISTINSISPVEEGSVWEWNYDVYCRDLNVIPKGSRAEVIERTGMTPHDEIMERGYNLLIHTANGTTVWATFEQCVSRGLLKRIK